MDEQSRQLARSWEVNAEAWTKTVRTGGLPSRRLATDAAILDVVQGLGPSRVLDVGCGEGWLVRALSDRGVQATGLDAAVALIDSARSMGGGEFLVCSYSELIERPERVGSEYGAIILNFALFEQDLAPLLAALRTRLATGGALVIQTVHPWSGGGSYEDGWRTETFAGLEGFSEPMPWYFRTLSSWVDTLREAGYRVDRLHEPSHPDSHEPLSLLILATPTA